MKIKFHGVRGSICAPLLPSKVEDKILQAVLRYAKNPMTALDYLTSKAPSNEAALESYVKDFIQKLDFSQRSTFGGNTTCVEVRVGGELIILDMGSGMRELGISLMGETIAKNGIQGTILQSHTHWDHINGLPFFPQLYMPNKRFDNRFLFHGGKDWDKSLEEVLRGQMSPPMFPVDHREIEKTAMKMEFDTIWDGKEIEGANGYGDNNIPNWVALCRKLNHPQETYGYRIEGAGRKIAFCTDHEPYAALHKPLIELAKDVDIWITDCQYTYHEYAGTKGVPKLGWGHSYPEYIAQVAREAKPKLIVTTHHDPSATDEHIQSIAEEVEKLSGITTVAAYEGMIL